MHWTGSAEGTQVVTAADVSGWPLLTGASYPVKNSPSTPPQDQLVGDVLSVHELLAHLAPPLPWDSVHFTSVANPYTGQVSARLSRPRN